MSRTSPPRRRPSGSSPDLPDPLRSVRARGPAARLSLLACLCWALACDPAGPTGGPRFDPPPELDAGGADTGEPVDGGAGVEGGQDAGLDAGFGLAGRLADSLERTRARLGGLGVVAGVRFADGGVWLGSSGFADAARTVRLRPTDKVRVYSVTKTFTAALVLQLVEEGRLSLDDTLDRWYPAFPNAATMRVRHLLSHSSGAFDYLGDAEVRVRLLQPWDPEELIARAAAHAPLFAPGTASHYSNTNYLLLGRLVERAGGDRYVQQLRRRLLTPLGLTDTFLEGFEAIPYTLVQGTVLTPSGPVPVGAIVHPSLSWSAGGLQSSAPDLLAWLDGLGEGRATSPASAAAMKTRALLPDGGHSVFGLGLMVEPVSSGLHLAHLGGGALWDFQCYLGRLEPHDLTVTACSSTGGAPGTEYARQLWSELFAPDAGP